MEGLQSAAAGCDYQPDIPPGGLLFPGQRRHDRTLIQAGRSRDAREFLPQIRAMPARHSTLLLKANPPDADDPGLLALELGFPASRWLTDNFYKLMSTDHVRGTVSLSSGAGLEARYFGKESCHLLALPCRLVSLGETGPHTYLDLDWSLLAPDFWRGLLAPHLPCSAPYGRLIPFKPSRLHISLNASWRFNEIDSDVTAAASRA
jgi:hypothetical protein